MLLLLLFGSTFLLGVESKDKIEVWRESSFQDFAGGRFGDGGANVYVSRKGRIRLINSWDLNEDGFLDLVFANTHPHQEKLDAVIFWGNSQDFDISRVSYIPNDGAQRAVAADLDRDGQMDLVFPNYANGTWDGMDSFVYYGGIEELKLRRKCSQWGFYPFSRKWTLPTRAAQDSAVSDLNKDGYPDIVFALSAGFWEYRASREGYESPSRIYWGSKEGFHQENRMDLPTIGASSVEIADLNKDSWPDLVFANRERAGDPDVNSFIYWGGQNGFDPKHRSEVPTRQANAVSISDINGDDWLDLAFANGQGDRSYVYLNNGGRFAPDQRLELPTHDARDCAVSDLNRDGFADIFFTNHQASANPLTVSYLYWGSPEGYSPERREEFETVGAWGVSLADLNRDSWEEIIVSNYKEHFSYDVPSYIYWNSPKGFTRTRRTALFTQGAVGNVVADFDGDGHVDLLFNNTVGRSRGGIVPVFVYWGNSLGEYCPEDRIALPSVDPYEWAAADLNDDGWTDLVIANWGETVRWAQESFVYWGNEEGFSPQRRSALMGYGSGGASIADLDRDGSLDVVLSNSAGPEDEHKGAFIYWGNPDGFVTSERTELPVGSSGIATIADLNEDGFLELLFTSHPSQGIPIFWGEGTRNYSVDRRTFVPGSENLHGTEVADLNRDGNLDLILSHGGSPRATGYIYWGNQDHRYSSERRSSFETQGTNAVTIGDVNQDGWLDLVCPNYNTGSSRATLSRVYLGSPEGIHSDRMFTLPNNAGAGSMVADFNQDGYADILFVCHRSEGDPNRIGAFGDHVNDSFLYWGGADGFRADRRLSIPVRGPHFDSSVDLGNIYDRSLRFDYVSSAHHYAERSPETITWKAHTPHGSAVRLQIRTAASEKELSRASWRGSTGPGTYFQGPAALSDVDPSDSWIQYRPSAILELSPNGAASPVLEEVTVVFR